MIINIEQAGAELCQAQYILGLAKQAVSKYPAMFCYGVGVSIESNE